MAIPDWAKLAFVWGFGFFCMLLVAIGAFWLKRKYLGPYTLRDADAGLKWRWAAEIALFETSPFTLGVSVTFLFGLSNLVAEDLSTLLAYLGYCLALVIGPFMLVFLLERWGMEKLMQEYLRIDHWRKHRTDKYSQPHMSRSLSIIAFASQECEQFLEKGYPDD